MQPSHDSRSSESKPVHSSVLHRKLPLSPSHWNYSPLNSPENNGRRARTTRPASATTANITPQRRNRDPSGKPEDHRDSFNGSDGILMGELGEAVGGKDEVGDGEKGPNGGEEHEVHAVGGP